MSQPLDCYQTDTKVLIAQGSNATSQAGEPKITLSAALKLILNESVQLCAQSRQFTTPAFPAGSGADFVNAAAILKTTLSPSDLLAHLHHVEAQFQRTRGTRWGARTLDLDLIAYGNHIAPNRQEATRWINLPFDDQTKQAPNELILPHPRLQDRSFVLVPLMDIAPEWRHPILNRTVAQMLAARPEAEKAAIVPISGGN